MEMHNRFNKKQIGSAIALVFYTILMSVPWQPQGFSSGLDESYTIALRKAFAENFQFGKDFVYTYGPYGILQHDHYFPGAYAAQAVGRAFIGLILGIGLLRITHYCWSQHKWSVLGLLPIFFSFPNLGINRDSFHIYFLLLPLLIYFYVDSHIDKRNGQHLNLLSLLLLVVGMSLVGLIKQTFLILGTAIVLLITLDQVFKKRQLPVVLVTYLTSLLGFWLLAGQRLSNIGDYLANNAQITKGFSETMGLSGPTIEMVVYLIVASVFFAAIVVTTWQRDNVYRLLPVMGLLLTLFLIFKSAFTRHDGHALQASESIIPLVSLYSGLLWSDFQSLYLKVPRIKLKVPVILLMWTLVIINAQFISSRYSEMMYRERYLGAIGHIGSSLSHAVEIITGQANLQAIYEDSAEQIRVASPLPKAALSQPESTTDLYPNDVSVLFSHELAYRPRPVIQSFSAYTTELAALNAASLADQRSAPETILFDIRTIDDRLPSSDDGASWPNIWTHYNVVDASGSFLVLKRKSQPNDYEMRPLMEQTARVGDWIEISDISSSEMLWMNIDIAPTLVGKVFTTLLKRPPLYVDVELANGVSNRYRVLSDIMRNGHLLSPAVTERGEFAYLASTNWQKTLVSSGVKRFRLVAEGASAIAYPSTYSLKLSNLNFPRQDLSNIPGWKTLKSFIALKSSRITSSNDKQAVVRKGRAGSNVLLSQPGVKITLPLPKNSQQMSISYGLQDEAWQKAQEEGRSETVDGVEFRILAVSEDNVSEKNEIVLFSQWLDPHQNKADRGEKRVTLSLESFSLKESVNTKIVLETLSGPDNNDAWDLSYWTELDIQ